MDLDGLERLEREATPGPWKVLDPDGDRNWVSTVPDVGRLDFRRGCEVEIPHRESPSGRYYMEVPTSPGDGAFIVALRNAAPDLIREALTLRADLAAARAEVERVDGERGEALLCVRSLADQCSDLRRRLRAAEADVERVAKALADSKAEEAGSFDEATRQRYRAKAAETDRDAQKARAEKAEAEVERLHVQLAGCSVAASGTDLDLSSDAYGWSVAFSDVAGLYRRMEKAEADVERLRAVLSEVRDECSRRVPRVTPRKT